jgi:Ras family
MLVHALFLFAAMVVRFITKRFIGEYDPNLEKTYTHSTTVDNEIVLFEILDAAGQSNVSVAYIL